METHRSAPDTTRPCRPKAADRAPVMKSIVRSFEERDRGKVREIFRQTGQRGNPVHTYIEDDVLPCSLFVDYYLDHEPDCCLVAEVDGTVAGYIVGCPDTRRYARFVALRILPRLVLRIVWKILTFQYRERKTYAAIWWAVARAWRELPRPPLDRYPAHSHLAVEQGYRRFLLHERLHDSLCDRLRAMGVQGIHGIVLEEVGKDAVARVLGTKVLAVRRTTVWDRSTGKHWNAKLLVRDL